MSTGQLQELMRVEFRGHTFNFYNTIDIDALTNSIFGDEYEIFKSDIKFNSGDVILDAGANEGVFSIMMAKCFPEVRVIAMEPVPRTFSQLMRNVGLNGFMPNLQYVNVGLGREPGNITLTMSKDHSGGSSLYCTYIPSDHEQIPITVIPLDQAFADYKIDRIRLLKMDIEGMEYDVLYGSKRLKDIDYFTGEFHINQQLMYRGRRLDGLANWLGRQTKIIHITTVNMAE